MGVNLIDGLVKDRLREASEDTDLSPLEVFSFYHIGEVVGT